MIQTTIPDKYIKIGIKDNMVVMIEWGLIDIKLVDKLLTEARKMVKRSIKKENKYAPLSTNS